MKILYVLFLLLSLILVGCGESSGGSNINSNILDTTIQPNTQTSTLTNLGKTTINAKGKNPTNIKLQNSTDEQGNTAIQIKVSGGDAQIILPENPITAGKRNAYPISKKDNYPISNTIDSYHSWFASAEIIVGGVVSYLRGDRIVKARLYKNILEYEEKTDIESAGFNLSYLEASRLMSICNTNLTTCGYQDHIPVLFIHGFQKETLGPKLDNNGGEGYWGQFPKKLIDKGYIPYEFRWSSNARFEDVANDLAKAIDTIYTQTGNKKIHIVAHSFGGILLRSLLQVGPQKAIPDYYHTSYSGTLIQNMIATATTVGSPHSGISDTAKKMHGFNFPQGQDSDGVDFFEGCQQISCHLMGEQVLNSYVANIFNVNAEAGEWAVKLNSTKTNLPYLNLQILIGFSLTLNNTFDDYANVLTSLQTASGDLLISGSGQRFYPDLALSGATETWHDLLHDKQFGNALVSEYIIGRKYDNDPNDYFIQTLQPEMKINWSYSSFYDGSNDITSFDIDYIPFKHSGGALGKTYSRWYSQEVCIGCGFEGSAGYNDTFQRVLDWMTNKIECSLNEVLTYNSLGAAYCKNINSENDLFDISINGNKSTFIITQKSITIYDNGIEETHIPHIVAKNDTGETIELKYCANSSQIYQCQSNDWLLMRTLSSGQQIVYSFFVNSSDKPFDGIITGSVSTFGDPPASININFDIQNLDITRINP